ncbi:FMC1 protein, partial [Cinclus mexicanus]|nr:FMC1 protein [Cinclus mexicanus]
QVTSEKLCRAQQELHFQAATYLCLLRSVREHEALHREGERSPQEVAGLVGFRLPQQPGGKG